MAREESGCVWGGSDDAGGEGDAYEIGGIFGACFGEEVSAVVFDGSDGDAEFGGDGFAGFAIGE